jgi:hypothetical protein
MNAVDMVRQGGLNGSILFGFARMARQVLGPETIGKDAKQMFEHGKHRFHPHSRTVKRDGRERRHV